MSTNPKHSRRHISGPEGLRATQHFVHHRRGSWLRSQVAAGYAASMAVPEKGEASRHLHLCQFPLKLFRTVRIKGVTARVFDRAVPPVFIEPEPLLGTLPDCWF